MGSSQTRGWTYVSCIGRQILYHWVTKGSSSLCFSFCFILAFRVHAWEPQCNLELRAKLMGTAFREQPLFTISLVLSSFLGLLSHYSILKAVSLLPHQYAFLLLHLHLRSSNRRTEKKNTKRISPLTLGATVFWSERKFPSLRILAPWKSCRQGCHCQPRMAGVLGRESIEKREEWKNEVFLCSLS